MRTSPRSGRRTIADTPLAVVLGAVLAAGCTPADGPGIAGAAATPPFAFDTAMRTTAIVRSDVETMLDALSRIEGWHARGGTGVRPSLRAGATQAQLDAVEAELGCRLPEEARAMWRWRDGRDGAGDGTPMVWYHDPLPVAQALADYRELRAEPANGWDASWFPVLYFEQEWYFVECTAVRAEASPVGHFFFEDEPRHAYANLTTYFATAADALAAGATGASVATGADDAGADDSGGSSDAAPPDDVAAIAAIHARHNPGIAFPYAVPETR